MTVCHLEKSDRRNRRARRGESADRPVFFEETNMTKRVMKYLAIVVLCLGAGVWANGQSTTQGAISGTVMDTTGAAIPGTRVLIHNNATNADLVVTSDEAG